MREVKCKINNLNFTKLGLISICVSIPFGFSVINIIIIAFTLWYFFHFSKENFFIRSNQNSIFLFFTMYFTVNMFSLFYTKNINYGLIVLSRLLYFIVIPFIIINSYKYLTKDFFEELVKYYILSCFVACMICLINASFNTYDYANVNPFNKNNGNFFSYIQLTKIIKKHPIYFGTNLLFAISMIFRSWVDNNFQIKINNNLKIALLIFLTLVVFLLNSFMLLIIYVVILFYFMNRLLKSFVLRTNVFKTLFTVTTVFLVLYLSSNFIIQKSKGVHFINDLTTRNYSGNDFTALKARNAKIYCSVEVIKNNFFLGVGAGDCQDELLKQYLKNNFLHGYFRKFNSHNQYLTTFISTGLFGFLILICILIMLMYFAIKNKNDLLFIFIVINALFFLSESVLERQQGIVFFVFFSSLIVVYQYNQFHNE